MYYRFTNTNEMAVNNNELCLQWADNNFQIFADNDLTVGRILGEFNGRVVKSTTIFTDQQRIFTMKIPQTGHIIDANEYGNPFRHLGHSCDPNTEAVIYVDGYQYKILYRTIKHVKKGDELTAFQDWEFDSEESIKVKN